MNRLYFGDNLKWLSDRREFPDSSVDLVYLDPPFNSNADYNVLGEQRFTSLNPQPATINSLSRGSHTKADHLSTLNFRSTTASVPAREYFRSWFQRLVRRFLCDANRHIR